VLFRGTKANDSKATSRAGGGVSSSATSKSPTTSLPAGWIQQAADNQSDCAAHSYGKVKQFFGSTPCSSVHRLLATMNQGGRPVVVAASVVTFGNATQAKQYLDLVTSDGTGNINDLLREGAAVAGLGNKLPEAAFASKQSATKVLVAEAAYSDGRSNYSDPTLKALANQAINTG
jgi:hypothetical protein